MLEKNMVFAQDLFTNKKCNALTGPAAPIEQVMMVA